MKKIYFLTTIVLLFWIFYGLIFSFFKGIKEFQSYESDDSTAEIQNNEKISVEKNEKVLDVQQEKTDTVYDKPTETLNIHSTNNNDTEENDNLSYTQQVKTDTEYDEPTEILNTNFENNNSTRSIFQISTNWSDLSFEELNDILLEHVPEIFHLTRQEYEDIMMEASAYMEQNPDASEEETGNYIRNEMFRVAIENHSDWQEQEQEQE